MPVVFTLESLAAGLKGHNPTRVDEPGVAEAAVSVILTSARNQDLVLLLIKRVEHEADPWSGQIALPGGRRDPEDSGLLATAVRETGEETGVDLSGNQPLGELDDVYPRTPVLPAIFVRPFVFYLPSRPRLALGPEVALAIRVTLGDLKARACRATVDAQGSLHLVDGYRIGPHFLWGLTERIVTPLLSLASS